MKCSTLDYRKYFGLQKVPWTTESTDEERTKHEAGSEEEFIGVSWREIMTNEHVIDLRYNDK